MKNFGKHWKRMAIVVMAAFAAAGCGVTFTDGSSDGDTASPPPLWETKGVNFAESSLYDMSLLISAEMRTASTIDLYARVEDQSGNFVVVPRFNQYNFSITQGWQFDYVDMSEVPYPELLTGVEERMYVLAIDSSGSMGGTTYPTTLDLTKDAAKDFVDAALSAGPNRCSVVDFDDDAELAQSLTNNAALLYGAIDSLEAEGNTAIGEALVTSASQIGARPGRGAIVIMTDGENTSGRTPDEAVADIAKYGLPVFAIGIGVSDDPLAPEYDETIVAQLKTVTDATGGKAYYAPDPGADLSGAFTDILAQVPPRHDAYLLHAPLLLYRPEIQMPVDATVWYENVYGTHTATSRAYIEAP